jgi:hypothetical protein
MGKFDMNCQTDSGGMMMLFAIAGIVLLVLDFLVIYLAMPVFSYGFYGILWLLFFNAALLTGLLIALGKMKAGWIIGSVAALLAISGLFIFPIMSSWMLRTEKFHSLIGTVESSDFRTDVETLDLSQIRVVDSHLAYKRAEELMGQDSGLGSKVDIGRMSIQNVNGKLLWVGALEPSGLFKWKKMDGTPGYVTVSATNYRDAEIILNQHMRYTVNSYFGKNLRRHLYMNGFAGVGLTDFTLELNDQNKPRWVVSLYTKTIGWSGRDAYGVATVDPESGEIHEYLIADTPSWVDRIQPEEFVVEQLNAWGALKNGWWNQWAFGAKDEVTQTTLGTSLVYTSDGHARWYTGMTSVGSDSGTVGFVLVDTRTKEAKEYRITGPTELAARDVLNGAVSNFNGYHATFPIMNNIGGQPTYAATIKDGTGNIKKYGFVSGTNRAVFGIGDNIREAQRAYQASMRNNGLASALTGAVDLKKIQGVVNRFNWEVVSGNQTFYLMLEELPGKVFQLPSGNLDVTLTHIGDQVAIQYAEGNESTIDVIEYDNLNIVLEQSTREKVLEKEVVDMLTPARENTTSESPAPETP